MVRIFLAYRLYDIADDVGARAGPGHVDQFGASDVGGYGKYSIGVRRAQIEVKSPIGAASEQDLGGLRDASDGFVPGQGKVVGEPGEGVGDSR